MNQPNGRQAFLRAIESDQRRLSDPNPLQKALDDYHIMEQQRDQAVDKVNELSVVNGALLAETNMLREALERADADRIRLQAISSTLLGRLLSINDCIAGAVRASIKDGVEAVHAAKADDELEKDAETAQAILQRVQPQEPPQTSATQEAIQRSPLARPEGLPPPPAFRR